MWSRFEGQSRETDGRQAERGVGVRANYSLREGRQIFLYFFLPSTREANEEIEEWEEGEH